MSRQSNATTSAEDIAIVSAVLLVVGGLVGLIALAPSGASTAPVQQAVAVASKRRRAKNN
ncbi:hypothetical protein [Paenibacillus sp. 1P07SE]|uniref:hypothetical protein n=1 Tax=Paenibacillus sp. 1P07SE TaxID=3132209 RepID=UPI0039A5C419